jgi:hypothetical protein
MRKIKLSNSNIEIDGKVRLLLTGFGQQEIISTDDIITAIKLLPANHIAGLKKVNYDPLRLFQKLYYYLNIRPDIRSQGEFVQRRREINIYEFKTPKKFFHTLYHEVGHYVYFFTIDSHQRKEWATQLHHKTGFVSDYASKNAAEDFAECYSYFINEPEKLMSYSAKYYFIKTQVFNNKTISKPQTSVNVTF